MGGRGERGVRLWKERVDRIRGEEGGTSQIRGLKRNECTLLGSLLAILYSRSLEEGSANTEASSTLS